MKKNKIKHSISPLLLLILLIGTFTNPLRADNPPPSIFKIFEKYGNNKGVTMLEVSKELMKNYKIKHFKSIVFEDGRTALPEIRECIKKDRANAIKMKELIQNGEIISAYYRLKSDDNKINRYLIFKVGENYKTTLIYIEGELTPEELIEILK
ncbi:MAG: DUF6108 family protein [Bacteroidales bacterium]|nr:DUF6108 family protein [Bacteroidales bacterium]MDD4210109.1 DUF6108 family protein [Bacteroidales bacterium]